MLVSQLPDRRTINPGIAPDRSEQLHPRLHPPAPSVITNQSVITFRRGQFKPSQPARRVGNWGQIKPSRRRLHAVPVEPLQAVTVGPTQAVTATERFPIPDSLDPGYHLSTLFPPVRPRGGYLELRFLDAQPVQRIDEVVRTVAALMYDPTARSDAHDRLIARLDSIDSAWASAAAGDPSPDLRDILDIATAGVGRIVRSQRTESPR
jgi:glutamate--cysteine ligase